VRSTVAPASGYPVIEVTGGNTGNLPPQVLRPYDRREALSLKEAAEISGKSVETIRRWCSLYDIGRRIGGQWAVSHPALLMLLDGDRKALAAYLAGDRSGASVRAYFERARLVGLGLGKLEGPQPLRHRQFRLSDGVVSPVRRPKLALYR
jgi:hypothetical protein